METKICKKCNLEKPISEFNKKKGNPDGRMGMCRTCRSKHRKNKIVNIEYINVEHKICTCCGSDKHISNFSKNKYALDNRRSTCKDCDKIAKCEYRSDVDNLKKSRDYSRNYYRNHREILNKKKQAYRVENREKVRETNRRYRKNNLEKCRKWDRDWTKARKESDPLFVIKIRIRNRINKSLKKQGYTKKSSTYEILGCTYDFFMTYIESKFIDGMSWDNKNEWHLDHIIPLDSAKTEEDVIRLNHYTNFQPLWILDNLSKSNKMPKNVQFKLL